MNTFSVALPARSGHRHRHAPVAGAAATSPTSAAHRTAVPAEFAVEITLEAHQKAADYSSAKTRFGMIHTLVDARVLLVLTFGGLLQTFDTWAAQLVSQRDPARHRVHRLCS